MGVNVLAANNLKLPKSYILGCLELWYCECYVLARMSKGGGGGDCPLRFSKYLFYFMGLFNHDHNASCLVIYTH